MGSNPWVTGVEVMKTADLGCVWLFGHRSKFVSAGFTYSLGCTPALSVTPQHRCSCGMRCGALLVFFCLMTRVLACFWTNIMIMT